MQDGVFQDVIASDGCEVRRVSHAVFKCGQFDFFEFGGCHYGDLLVQIVGLWPGLIFGFLLSNQASSQAQNRRGGSSHQSAHSARV